MTWTLTSNHFGEQVHRIWSCRGSGTVANRLGRPKPFKIKFDAIAEAMFAAAEELGVKNPVGR